MLICGGRSRHLILKCSERVCGIVEEGSTQKGKGRGVCRGYRWAGSLDLKQCRDLATTISWGMLFHLGMVRGKNDICLYCVLQEGML